MFSDIIWSQNLAGFPTSFFPIVMRFQLRFLYLRSMCSVARREITKLSTTDFQTMSTLSEKLTRNKQSTKWKKIVAENLDLDYCERFLTAVEGTALMEYMENNVRYLDGRLTRVKVFGQFYPIPRQQVAFGDDGTSYKFSGTVVPAQPWPQPVLELKNKICVARGVDYNFVLVNKYRNGEDHMGEHRDDERELDKTVPIASVSLGQTRKFVLKHIDVRKKTREIELVKLDLHHGSLLMMNRPTNEYWYHSIPKEKKATDIRLNFTFRKIK